MNRILFSMVNYTCDFCNGKELICFWPKSPLKMGMGFEARAAHPCPTQI